MKIDTAIPSSSMAESSDAHAESVEDPEKEISETPPEQVQGREIEVHTDIGVLPSGVADSSENLPNTGTPKDLNMDLPGVKSDGSLEVGSIERDKVTKKYRWRKQYYREKPMITGWRENQCR